MVTQKATPSYKGTLLYHSCLGLSGSAVRLQRGWDSSVEGHGRWVCDTRASAWQDKRPGEKGAAARQGLILHSTWKQKRGAQCSLQVSPGTEYSAVTGLQVTSAVTVLPLLGSPSMWARLDRWADGLKRGPSRPPCVTLPPATPTQ